MKEYLGKTCPYCKTEIKDGEDIIACSDCGMPHHKECWIENQGCTTFGCLGTIQGVHQSAEQSAMEIQPQPSEEKLGCFKCGALNPFSNSFCRNCGARLLKPLGTNSKPAADHAENPQIALQANQGGTNLQIIGSLAPKSAVPVAPAQPQAFLQPYGNSAQAGNAMPQNRVNPQVFQQPYGNPAQAGNAMPQNRVNPQAFQQPYGNSAQAGNAMPQNRVNPQAFQQPYGNPAQAGNAMSQNRVNPQSFQQPNANPVQNVSEEDFIKVNSDFYRQKFMEMKMENKKFTWNWAAWFFNVFWCFYRKMYKVGLIALGIQLIGLVLVEIEPILSLLTALGLGALGNNFYMRYTEEALKKAQNVPDLQRYTYLRKKGGTSVGAVFIVFGGLFVIGVIYGVIQQFLSYME